MGTLVGAGAIYIIWPNFPSPIFSGMVIIKLLFANSDFPAGAIFPSPTFPDFIRSKIKALACVLRQLDNLCYQN